MRRIFKIGVALAAAGGLAVGVIGGAGALYLDVDWGEDGYEYISAVTNGDVMNGTGGMEFSPDEDLTRCQAVAVFGRLAGAEPSEGGDGVPFLDVPEGAYYAPYLNWALELGIISEDQFFRPQEPVSRQELAAMALRYAKAFPAETAEGEAEPSSETEAAVAFADMDAISPWALEAVVELAGWGVVDSGPQVLFDPLSPATRGQAAELMARLEAYLGRSMEASGSIEPSVELTPSLLRYIYHAGGYTGQDINSNSLEALNASYDPAGCVIELDFNWTSDGELAAIHYWSYGYVPEEELPLPLTDSQWRQAKVFGKYTSLDLSRLITWLYENPAAYIMTDVKEGNLAALEKIAADYPQFVCRFIPQIYSYEEYQPVRDLGYENIVLTVYMMSSQEAHDFERIRQFVSENNILAVTFPVAMADEPGYVAALEGCGALLLTHTANGPETRAHYFSLGVDGIYTDFAPDWPDQPEGTG